jgi:hypothetical protein
MVYSLLTILCSDKNSVAQRMNSITFTSAESHLKCSNTQHNIFSLIRTPVIGIPMLFEQFWPKNSPFKVLIHNIMKIYFLSHFTEIQLLLLLLLLLLLFVISFMQGIYNYLSERNPVSRVYNIATIPWLHFMVHVILLLFICLLL